MIPKTKEEFRAWLAKMQKAQATVKRLGVRYNNVDGTMVEDKDGVWMIYEDHRELLSNTKSSSYQDGKDSNYSWRL